MDALCTLKLELKRISSNAECCAVEMQLEKVYLTAVGIKYEITKLQHI